MTALLSEQDLIGQNQNLEISHSYSVNTISSLRDYIISEDLLAGQRINGRMSNVRRFFCLFVTFDLLFTGLMWIICIMLAGEYLMDALKEQVVHYNIHTSLFDVVLMAAFRFVVLIFFYGLLYVNHWLVISLSTSLTCAFLIAKVFLFDWPHSSQPVFEVLLVLTSFIISWGEAWFLDFKVIPQETHANRYIITADSERAPLIRSYIQGIPSMYTESVSNFHSPLGTPEGSLNRFEQNFNNSNLIYPTVKLTIEEENQYKKMAAKILEESWDLYQKSDWKFQKKNDDDVVYIRSDSKGKKMFKLRAAVDKSSKYLLDEIFYRVHDMPKWHSNIKESRKIQAIDEYTDLTYQISKDAVGGMVSSRDFVNLRHWAYYDNRYVIASVKTEHPSFPVSKKLTRGENDVGCTVLEPHTDPNKCILTWIVNVDLKLQIPSIILDKEMCKMMLKFPKDLREYLKTKPQRV